MASLNSRTMYTTPTIHPLIPTNAADRLHFSRCLQVSTDDEITKLQRALTPDETRYMLECFNLYHRVASYKTQRKTVHKSPSIGGYPLPSGPDNVSAVTQLPPNDSVVRSIYSKIDQFIQSRNTSNVIEKMQQFDPEYDSCGQQFDAEHPVILQKANKITQLPSPLLAYAFSYLSYKETMKYSMISSYFLYSIFNNPGMAFHYFELTHRVFLDLLRNEMHSAYSHLKYLKHIQFRVYYSIVADHGKSYAKIVEYLINANINHLERIGIDITNHNRYGTFISTSQILSRILKTAVTPFPALKRMTFVSSDTLRKFKSVQSLLLEKCGELESFEICRWIDGVSTTDSLYGALRVLDKLPKLRRLVINTPGLDLFDDPNGFCYLIATRFQHLDTLEIVTKITDNTLFDPDETIPDCTEPDGSGRLDILLDHICQKAAQSPLVTKSAAPYHPRYGINHGETAATLSVPPNRIHVEPANKSVRSVSVDFARVLNFSNCNASIDKSIIALVKVCPNIQEFIYKTYPNDVSERTKYVTLHINWYRIFHQIAQSKLDLDAVIGISNVGPLRSLSFECNHFGIRRVLGSLLAFRASRILYPWYYLVRTWGVKALKFYTIERDNSQDTQRHMNQTLRIVGKMLDIDKSIESVVISGGNVARYHCRDRLFGSIGRARYADNTYFNYSSGLIGFIENIEQTGLVSLQIDAPLYSDVDPQQSHAIQKALVTLWARKQSTLGTFVLEGVQFGSKIDKYLQFMEFCQKTGKLRYVMKIRPECIK